MKVKSTIHKIHVKMLVLLGRAIDVGSGGIYPSDELSNFMPYQFTFRGIVFNSMESLLQGLKFEDVDKQNRIFALIGKAAKRKGKMGKWYLTQTLFWQGNPMERESSQYENFIREAYDALAENVEFKKALLATGNKKLYHTIGKSKLQRTILTEKEFCTILTELRNKL